MVRVLYAASEAVPFIKTGGLADVCGSLPAYMDKKAFDVRVIIPKYCCMKKEFLSKMQFLFRFYVDLGWRKQYVGVFTAKENDITYYLLDNEFYFGGDRPYHYIHEDVEKFAFFSKAVLETIARLDFFPDIIHCHDWQTGLIPVYLKSLYQNNPLYANVKTVFTIHNLKFQGCWNIKGLMDITGLPAHFFTSDKLEFYGEGNLLKGGCVYADRITTVSETYAKEICTKEGGEGLDGLFLAKKQFLSGIENGIDVRVYNPAVDAAIAYPYNAQNVGSLKRENKLLLQKKAGLLEKEQTMLCCIVSRLTTQKGLDLLIPILEQLLQTLDMQLVVMGTGEKQYEDFFCHLSEKYPRKLFFANYYEEDAAHRIYASSDVLLMPSQFEPCGLSQMIAMHYGTLPIVRETGGLKDSVIAYNQYDGTGTGFSFREYQSHDLWQTISYAWDTYTHHRKQWDALVRHAMKMDFSWNASAKKYEKLYLDLL